jgi:flagellar motor switch/type III secretory pathway protein FliN
MNNVYTSTEEEIQRQPLPQHHKLNQMRTTNNVASFSNEHPFQSDSTSQAVQRARVTSREVSTTLDGKAQMQQQEVSEKQQIEARERHDETGLKLKIDLNLDIEVELKAKIRGDLTLSLLYVLPPSIFFLSTFSFLDRLWSSYFMLSVISVMIACPGLTCD